MNQKGQKKGTILIVDDAPANLELLFIFLEREGYKAYIAQDGRSAIEQAEELQPDIILLDVMLPGIDGFETCRRLKAKVITQAIPVIFITALTDEHNKVAGFEAGGIDYVTKPLQMREVSARINTHITLQRQKKALQIANATKDKFFSIVAHDIKNNFGAVMGFADFLVDSIKTAERERIDEVIQHLHKSAKATYKLLENLLHWARLQQGLIEYKPSMVELRATIEEIISLFSGNTNQKDISLIHTISEEVTVYVDGNMLHTILRNLISNALKFTPAGGTITLSITHTSPMVELAIRDTGVGIEPEYVDSLFRIDQKYSTRGTHGEKGTGVGLILCKEMVERNGGTIWVESTPGEGTTFYATFPPAPPNQQEDEEA